MTGPDYAPLDAALDSIADRGIVLRNGNSNHAPMAMEALCALGRPQAVRPWLDRYRERMLPRPPADFPIAVSEWRGALGQRERFADWSGFFAAELDAAPWREVLDRWVERLSPGFCAAAAHGVIRVGHAARSLAVAETPSRRRELADALAGWAATYQELLALPAPSGKTLSPVQAFTSLRARPAERRGTGNITAALASLTADELTADPIDPSDDTGDLLAGLTELFARVYLANAHDIRTAIAFIHGVTGLAALGNIARHIGETALRAALPYAWRTGCALYVCFGSTMPSAREIAAVADDRNALIDRAIANGDEHVVKFTEACLARHAIRPSPAYLAAAAHVGEVIRRN
jgi:hypothetical protein